MIRAVCFDMDGLLTDTERIGLDVTCHLAQAQGFPVTQAHRSAIAGLTLSRAIARLQKDFPRLDGAALRARWYDETLSAVQRDGLPLKPYAREVLCALRRRKVKLALTSSNAQRMVEAYLRLAGWEDAFDLVLHGGMVKRSKPDPELYLLAARLLGLAPEECAGVEDSPNGVRAVKAAGMVSVMIPDLLPCTADCPPLTDILLTGLNELEAALFGGEP